MTLRAECGTSYTRDRSGDYRALAAAVLRSAFEETHSTTPRGGGRVKAWLFLFTERAEFFADAVGLTLARLRALAWEEGLVQGGGTTSRHAWKAQPFRAILGLDGLYPAGPDGGCIDGRQYPPWDAATRQQLRCLLGLPPAPAPAPSVPGAGAESEPR